MLRGLFNRKQSKVQGLYAAIVAASRQRKFYAEWGVPDTVDGRFDVLVLHLALTVARLRGHDEALRKELVDRFCEDMDDNLRELGASDTSVGKKVRHMAEAFQGRYGAYEAAADLQSMQTAILRNVYSGKLQGGTAQMANHALHVRSSLQSQSIAELISTGPKFDE